MSTYMINHNGFYATALLQRTHHLVVIPFQAGMQHASKPTLEHAASPRMHPGHAKHINSTSSLVTVKHPRELR
jgi:hypothetical protein